MSTEYPGLAGPTRYFGLLVEISCIMAMMPGWLSAWALVDRILGNQLGLNPWMVDLMVVGSLVFSIAYAFLLGRAATGRTGGYGGTPTRRWILLNLLMWVMLGLAMGVFFALLTNDALLHPVALFAYPAALAFLVGGFWLPGRIHRWMDAHARAVHAHPESDPRYVTAEGRCFDLRSVGRAVNVMSLSFTDHAGQERYFRMLSDRWVATISPLLIMYRVDDPSRIVHVCDVRDRRARRRKKG